MKGSMAEPTRHQQRSDRIARSIPGPALGVILDACLDEMAVKGVSIEDSVSKYPGSEELVPLLQVASAISQSAGVRSSRLFRYSTRARILCQSENPFLSVLLRSVRTLGRWRMNASNGIRAMIGAIRRKTRERGRVKSARLSSLWNRVRDKMGRRKGMADMVRIELGRWTGHSAGGGR